MKQTKPSILNNSEFQSKHLRLYAKLKAMTVEDWPRVTLSDLVAGIGVPSLSSYERESIRSRLRHNLLDAMSYANGVLKLYGNFRLVRGTACETYAPALGMFRGAYPVSRRVATTPILVDRHADSLWESRVTIQDKTYLVHAETLDCVVAVHRALLQSGPGIMMSRTFGDYETVLGFQVSSTHYVACSSGGSGDLESALSDTGASSWSGGTARGRMGPTVTRAPWDTDDTTSPVTERSQTPTLSDSEADQSGVLRSVRAETMSEGGDEVPDRGLALALAYNRGMALSPRGNARASAADSTPRAPSIEYEGFADEIDVGFEIPGRPETPRASSAEPTETPGSGSRLYPADVTNQGVQPPRPVMLVGATNFHDLEARTSGRRSSVSSSVFGSSSPSTASSSATSVVSSINGALCRDMRESQRDAGFDPLWFRGADPAYLAGLQSGLCAPIIEVYQEEPRENDDLDVLLRGRKELGSSELKRRRKDKSYVLRSLTCRRGCAFFYQGALYSLKHVVELGPASRSLPTVGEDNDDVYAEPFSVEGGLGEDITPRDVTGRRRHNVTASQAAPACVYLGETAVSMHPDNFRQVDGELVTCRTADPGREALLLRQTEPELGEECCVYYAYRSKPSMLKGVRYTGRSGGSSAITFTTSANSRSFPGLSGALILDKQACVVGVFTGMSVGGSPITTLHAMPVLAPLAVNSDQELPPNVDRTVSATEPVTMTTMAGFGYDYKGDGLSLSMLAPVTDRRARLVAGFAHARGTRLVMPARVYKAVTESRSRDLGYVSGVRVFQDFTKSSDVEVMVECRAGGNADAVLFTRTARNGEEAFCVWAVPNAGYFGPSVRLRRGDVTVVIAVTGQQVVTAAVLPCSAFSGSLLVAASDGRVLAVADGNQNVGGSSHAVYYSPLHSGGEHSNAVVGESVRRNATVSATAGFGSYL